jgi:SAM-dependent methyltransferase
MDDDVQALVVEQLGYYRAWAPDYDDVYLGKDWDLCIEELPIAGDVLELACGSGHWTPLLAARGRSVTAVDAAPEMLAFARQRARGLPVEFIQADVFAWQPPRRYDTVFFAFWLTHVPPTRFANFWSIVGTALAPGGRVCFVDDSDRERAGERFCARPGDTGGLAPAWRRQRAPGGQGLLHAGSAYGQVGRAGLVGRRPRDEHPVACRDRSKDQRLLA